MTIRSMTGFARVRRSLPGGELIVSLKSVNHRGLDLHFHSGAEFDPHENALRTLFKQQIVRGHLDVRLSWLPSQAEPTFTVNRRALESYLNTFREIANEHGLASAPDLTSILRLPGMTTETAGAEAPAGFEEALLAAAADAVEQLNQFRTQEGAALAADILNRSRSLTETSNRMEQVRSRVYPVLQARLQDRLHDLLRGISIDPQRLAQEAAILADRSDIGEEIIRLRIHADQVQKILQVGGEVGKKLDFLCQELNREANTILSKTNGVGESGLGMTDLALVAKSDIEKIREQALNLE